MEAKRKVVSYAIVAAATAYAVIYIAFLQGIPQTHYVFAFATILDLVAKGYTTQQIADALHLSYETIRWYRKKLLVKFNVSNTAELIAIAKEYDFI